MRSKKLLVTMASVLMLSAVPFQVFAADSGKEADAKKESAQISSSIDKTLQQANEKYREIESLKKDVSDTQNKISETQKSIKDTEASIKKRTDAMAGRMKDIQVNESSFNLVDAVMSADNLSDFISRVHAVNVIQGAERTKVETLAADKDKLEKLQSDLSTNQQTLANKEETLSQEKSNLDEDVAGLKQQLKDNQKLLDTLSKDRIAKEAIEQKEKADKEKAAKQKEEAQKQTAKQEAAKISDSNTQSSSPASQSDNSQPAAEQPIVSVPSSGTSSGGGRTLSMQSTAYSYSEAGLTPFTATGLDLRKNPNAIAVDPSIIPLNSIVEVSGYGLAIAADTGGAIKGNIIDVHFPTVDQCYAWGRRQVTVTIK
ncbi:3D domain-containing protein [Vagococcus vulneris]|uniref:3D domain-containing protein n=1 Tax=Vagococcus vulneris TaxID=1977869 RepID=UPI000F7EAC5F|nr:3D domain-containing protein [Vagococcus vulneris]